MPSLSDFVNQVPRIYSGNLNDLDSEWRNLDTTPNVRDLSAEDNNIVDFYNKLGEMKDNEGLHQFQNLASFALQVLALPTSNTSAERMFSKLNLIKTDIRNRLQMPALQALTVLSEAVKLQECCYKFTPSENMINSLLT